MTSKYPLVCILAEFREWLTHLRMDLALDWYPRDQNEEADALSNSDFSEFTPANRVNINLERIQWFLLNEYLAAADDMYNEVKNFRMPDREGKVKEKKEKKEHKLNRKHKKDKPLRERDPW